MMDDSIAGGSHTPMLARVLISRLGIFQIQMKNSTRGEGLRTQLRSHDMHGNDVVYPSGGENDATTKANVIILGRRSKLRSERSEYAKLPVTEFSAVSHMSNETLCWD